MLEMILIGMTGLDGTLVFRSDSRHSLTEIVCGQFNHKIVYQRLFVTSPFIKQFVEGGPRQKYFVKQGNKDLFYFGFTGRKWQKFVIFWFHGTERQSFALPCFRGTERQNFALRCFHGSDCQRFTLKSVTSLMRLGGLIKGSSQATSASRLRDFQRSTTRTEQGIGLLTIPVLVAGGQFGQSKFALLSDSISSGQATFVNWTSHFCKLSFLGWRTQAANHNRRNLLTLGAALVLFFGGWVFGVLSPMADHSGQTTRERVKPVDASSTLAWTCKSSPFYREKSRFGRVLLLR